MQDLVDMVIAAEKMYLGDLIDVGALTSRQFSLMADYSERRRVAIEYLEANPQIKWDIRKTMDYLDAIERGQDYKPLAGKEPMIKARKS